MKIQEKRAIVSFIQEQSKKIQRDRKQFDDEKIKERAKDLCNKLEKLGTNSPTAHQYVEDALRYMAFLLADSALHKEANTAGFELNRYHTICHKLLGHKKLYRWKRFFGILVGFTHKPLRLGAFVAAVWGLFAGFHLLIWFLTKCPAIIYQSNPNIQVSWWGYFYFSAVTLTTLGYGDICPDPQHTLAALISFLACLEAILGYLALGLFITLLLKYAGTHPYARISRWIDEYEQSMLPINTLKNKRIIKRNRLYHPDWSGYLSKIQ